MKLGWSTLAKADLAGVKRYSVRQWGVAVARQYLADLRDEAAILARQPDRARRLDARYDFRRVRSHYLIVNIDAAADRLTIVRILHTAMNIEGHLPTD